MEPFTPVCVICPGDPGILTAIRHDPEFVG